MTSRKFWGFLDLLPPCHAFWTNHKSKSTQPPLLCHVLGNPLPPLERDVIYGWSLRPRLSQKATVSRCRSNIETGPVALTSHPIHLRIGFVGFQLVFALVVVVEVAASLLWRRGSDVVVWGDLGSSEAHQILPSTAVAEAFYREQ